MADFVYQRQTNRFLSLGMDLNRPVDALKEGKYRLLKNVRSYQTGRLEPRQGLTAIAAVDPPAHSIRRLNAPRTSDWTRVIGGNSSLFMGKNSFTKIDTGYSGDPLALVPYRPPQSPDPWMYVMDSARQRKVSVTGLLHQVGMPPPTSAPLVGRTAVYHKAIFPPNMSLSGWNNGPPFVGTEPEAVQKVNTSIATILYDTGSTGWCLVEPGVSTGIAAGMLLTLGSEDVVVQSSTAGVSSTTTIASMAVLGDGTGSSLVFSSLTSDISANTLLQNNTRGNFARIKAVVDGPTSVQAVICNPPAGWAVGDTVQIQPSFRCFTVNTQSTGGAITNTVLSYHVTPTQDGGNVGFMCSPKFSPALDLSQITPSIASTPDSFISIDLYLGENAAQEFQSMRVMFGCTDTGDISQAFQNNFFEKTFSLEDLTLTGDSVTFKLSALEAVGSPTLKNIFYIQVELTSQPWVQNGPTFEVRVFFGSLYLAGTPGPDVGAVGADYIYRYRARCSPTGVVSNWSPATVERFPLTGESVTLTAPVQYTLATEADFIDFQRRGGSLPDDWFYVGSVANTGSPTSFTDQYPDDVIIANPSEDQIHYQLWPVIGAPVSGTLTSTSGVMVSGVGFNTAWAPQTPILINGVFYTIYQVYSSTLMQLFESAGNQSNVEWEIPEPILQAQPLPCFWGPLDEVLFACGDPINPQRLYWTNTGDADSTQLSNWKDVTTPSEPLMNGTIFNSRSHLWSSDRFFQIVPNSSGSYDAGVLPNCRGLWARWAFTSPQSLPGDNLFFLARDGIFVSDGGITVNLAGADLMRLFPNEGNPGVSVNGVPYPLMLPETQSQFRVAFYDKYLYFDYVGPTFAVPITVAVSDSLNNWTDTVGAPRLQAGFVEYLNAWADGLAIAVGTAPFNFSDSLNQWADAVARA